MLPIQPIILKMHERSDIERECLKIIKRKRKIETDVLISQLSEKYKKSNIEKAIVYLINGYEIKRNGSVLEYMTWDM